MLQSGSESHELKSKRTSPMTLDDEDPDTLNEFDRKDYEVAFEARFYRAARRKAIECYPESFSRTSSSGRHPGGDNDSDVSQSAPPSKRVKRECRNPYCEVLHHLLEWRLSDVIDAQVYYVPEFVGLDLAQEWYNGLKDLMPWYRPKLRVFGKDVTQSRSIAAFTTEEYLTVKYSGHTVRLHHVYPPLLLEIQKRVEEFMKAKFNHVMLNYYEDGTRTIGKHRDTDANKIIATLTLGATRTLILLPNPDANGVQSKKIPLASGSLFVMAGQTQEFWKHEIRREPDVKEGRISLTFRQMQVRY